MRLLLLQPSSSKLSDRIVDCGDRMNEQAAVVAAAATQPHELKLWNVSRGSFITRNYWQIMRRMKRRRGRRRGIVGGGGGGREEVVVVGHRRDNESLKGERLW